MIEFTVKFDGAKNPLVVHAIRLANPLDSYAKELKRLNAKRKKTDEDYAEVSKVEWEGGLYFDDDIGPFIPASYPQRVLLEAARITREGRTVERAVTCMAEDGSNRIPIDYDGPRDLEGMWSDERFRDVRMVKVGQSRVLRTRPRFEGWTVTFVAILDDRLLNPDDFREIVARAGRNVGMGEAPEGSRARFDVDVTARETVTA